ncbi:pyridoxamine 5'-phosphate oxidase family protein [Ulvibacterium sp.]|uniref:pyridoxamine 5'-phosphate oxidase family protein n=1 Tax=Ulvibacterium sp. TaxID=2665914 RepID=UPI00261C865C|nr:pyridoxamine 5'-phosphate oxidase family protein [Ulvibacterium sp.]
MNTVIWKELSKELRDGVTEKGHPFRYCTMATVGLERMPRLRTVVLRKVSDNLDLSIYTDQRSKKIMHIKENNRVSLLFYHPEKMVQIKIEGLAGIHTDPKTLEKHWNKIKPGGRKDYTTSEAPGSDILDPHAVEYLEDNNYFCMVEIEPFKIEYLKLQQPGHLRIKYSKIDHSWKSEFLVP